MKKLFLYILLPATFSACEDINNLPLEDAKPIVLKAVQQKRIAQDNDFAFELFKQTREVTGERNLMVSPLSVSIALGMTRNGAVGETLEGMNKTLRLSGLSDEEINDYYQNMITNLPLLDKKTTLNIANSIWYRKSYPVKPDFLQISKQYFGAYVSELDFSNPAAKDSINNWCAGKTDNLITDILDVIPGNAVMYLVNAVYFKSNWRKKFDESKTTLRQFTNDKSEKIMLNMMYAKDTLMYAENSDGQFVDLEYGNKAFAMTVILPSAESGVKGVLSKLNTVYINDIYSQMSLNETELYLPRFKSKNKLLLNDPLMNMGMTKAFEDRNEFSRITDNSIFISRVLHDTSIEVTESGTIAAAATVVEMREKANFTRIVNANRPFIYIIREKSTGVILFIGSLENPAKF
jgi:serpin B